MAALAIWLAASEDGAELRRLTLTEGVHLAISQNRGLKIARLKVTESEQKKAGERSAYFPSITNQSNALHVTDPQNIGIPAGSLGTAAGSLVPAQNVVLPQGQKTFFSSGTMISQPLTQLIRIHQANRRSGADITVSKDDLKNSETKSLSKSTTFTSVYSSPAFKSRLPNSNALMPLRICVRARTTSATAVPSESRPFKAVQAYSKAGRQYSRPNSKSVRRMRTEL